MVIAVENLPERVLAASRFALNYPDKAGAFPHFDIRSGHEPRCFTDGLIIAGAIDEPCRP